MRNVLPFRVARRVLRAYFELISPANPETVERHEWIYYVSLLREGMTVFDVGANVGELTLLFSHFAGPSGQIHSFEPTTATFERLQSIVKASGRLNVRLNPLALADKNGVRDLYVYDRENASLNTLAMRPLEKYGVVIASPGTQSVAVNTVDSYCMENGINQIDLLKIDVEGAEFQVLLGARRMLESKQVRACVFEFGQTTFDFGNSPAMIIDFLDSVNYRIQNIVPRDRTFPHNPKTKEACFSLMVAKPR